MTDALVLSSKLDTASVDALVAELKARAGADVTVDASEVTHVGALAAQALMVAAADWKTTGHSFDYAAKSDAFTTQLETLGLTAAQLTSGGE